MKFDEFYERYNGDLLFPIAIWTVSVVMPTWFVIGYAYSDAAWEDDWGKVIFTAIMFCVQFAAAIIILVGAISIPFMDGAKPTPWTVLGAIVMASLPIRMIYYWYSRLVVENLPDFGMNPDNIYAVLGLNSFALWIWWGAQTFIAVMVITIIRSALSKG